MSTDPEPWRIVPEGLRVRLRLTPKSSRDEIEGIEPTAEGPALKARVRAVPADGAANTAASLLLAAWLGVAKGAVSLASGGKSRIKTFKVAGEGKALAAIATARISPTGAKEEPRV